MAAMLSLPSRVVMFQVNDTRSRQELSSSNSATAAATSERVSARPRAASHAAPDALVVDTARRFAQERLAPHAAAREKSGQIEPEIIRELGELGFLGATTSTEWGGAEIDPLTYALLLEEIAAGDGSVSTLVSVHNSPTCAVLEKFGTAVQKDRWLRPLASGEHVGSFGLTEPQAGSDAAALRTR